MPSDHHLQILYRSPVIAVGNNICNATGKAPSPEKWSGSHKIVFPRSGLFVNMARGKQILADPNQIIFYNRDEEYRTAHPVAGGDKCTAFVIDETVLSEIRFPFEGATLQDHAVPFPFDSVISSSDMFVKHRMLLHRLSGQSSVDKIEIDEIALDLAGIVLSEAYKTTNRNRRLLRTTLQSHLELVDRVKIVLGAKYRQSLSLSDIARESNSSPFHLCRIFKKITNLSIHQYLNRLRLRHSLEQVMDADLSRLALNVGFSSHSHFTQAFRREFGLSPSEMRHSANSKHLGKLSKNLTV